MRLLGLLPLFIDFSTKFVLAVCAYCLCTSFLWSIVFWCLVYVCSYSTIAWTASIHKGVLDQVDYGNTSSTKTGSTLNFFSALGDVAFAYAGHNVVLEIQATIPSTPEKPSKGPMWKGVLVAYAVVALCYFPVALVGYYIFGNKVDDNILITLEKPAWLIAAANLFVVVHVIGSYQVIIIYPRNNFSQFSNLDAYDL